MFMPSQSPTNDPTTVPSSMTLSPTTKPTIGPIPWPDDNIVGCFDIPNGYCPGNIGCFGATDCAKCNFPHA